MKKATLLLLSAFTVFMIYGCGGGGMGITGTSWESGGSNNPSTDSSNKTIEINGTFSAPAPSFASISPPLNHAVSVSNGRYNLSVIDKDDSDYEAGSVSSDANSFKAVIRAATANRHVMLILTDNHTKKVIYRNLLGKVPKISELPAEVKKIIINGVLIDETTTARALFAMEKGVSDIVLVSAATSEIQTGGIITKDLTGVKSEFDIAVENSAGGAANIAQMANAVQAVAAVLTSSQIDESAKKAVAFDQIDSATSLLTSYLNSLKNPFSRQLLTNNGFALSVKIGGTAINSTSDPATAANAVKNIAPITPVASPVFQPAGGAYSQDVSVAITTATPGASIKYTTDGSVPSALSGYAYSGPIAVHKTTTIKAIAIKSGYADSPVVSALYTLPLKADAPLITPAAGAYTSAQVITIVSATEGAVIKYTTDGTNPSETNGQTYSAPFTLSFSAYVRAIAIKSGMNNSNITAANFIINTQKASAPVFTPAGGTFSTAQSVTITTATTDAVIKYTTDGSEPSASNGLIYSAAITVAATSTIKAIAIKDGMADSDISSAAFIIQDRVSAPVFNPPAGSYASAQSVSIISATEGASIFYTTNGSEPTILSSHYTSAVSISSTSTLKAFAIKTGMAASAVSSADYTIMQKVSAPVFNLPAGSYEGTQSVIITSATSNALIYYTLDGSTPSPSSALYSGAISIASNLTVRSIAVKNGMADSDISAVSYTINFPPVSDPVFSVASGTYNDTKSVTITSPTENALIYYTLNNTNPSPSSYLYTSAIEIGNTAVIKAIAVKTGMSNSNISVASYIIDRIAPSFNIQYYSDAALSLSLGNNPRLSAGTYYLKITANKELQSAPKVTINAEGSANDVTNATTVLFSGYSYKYNRVIAADSAAAGSVVETIAISATDKAGNSASNIRPVNESTAAAYTDTIAPVATITYSPTSALVKQGATLAISAVISENLMGAFPLKIAIAGANTLEAVNMSAIDATHYSYSHTVGAGDGSATITLSNAKDLAGNPITTTPSAGSSFTVDNTAPAAPTAVTITPIGGNVRTNTLNSTNTNMTATANITAGQATGGLAQLLINDEIKAQDTTISASDTTLFFDLGKTTNTELRDTIPVGLDSKAVKVKLIDAAGNETTSSVSVNIKVDYTCPTGSISYLPSNTVYPGSPLTILANFSEDLADTPVMQIAINGSNSLSASNMSKITAAQYSYAYTVGNGNGEANITFASGTDKAGNPIVAAPTAGGSFTVNNTVLPAGVYKKTAVLDSINDVALAGNTLTVKTAGASVEYNVTNNTTVKNIMGGENNIKFTIDAEGKVSAIDDSLAAGASSIALVAADCAAALTLKGSDNGATALTSTAAFTKNITVTGGKADISNANLDGTLTVSAAATVTAGENPVSTADTAFTANITGTGLVTIGNASTVVISGVTIPGSNAATVQQAGTILTIGGTAAGAVSIASGSAITGVTINAGTVTSLTNNKATLESLTVNGAITTLTVDAAVSTLNANENITTLDINAGVGTLNIANAKTIGTATLSTVTSNAMTIAATGTGAITTLTIDGNFGTCALTVNDNATPSSAIGTLNIPAQTTSFTTAGSGTITTANITGAIPTVTINSTIGTLNIGTATQTEAFTVGTLDVNNTGSVTTAINVKGHDTLTAPANTPTITLLKTTGAGAITAINIGSAAGTSPGVVGTLTLLATATNVTVGATGDISTAVNLPSAYAGTWTSSAKDLTAATFTLDTAAKLAGTINLNVNDNVITTTSVTHQKEGNYADGSVEGLVTATNGAKSDIASNVITLTSISATADTFSYGVSADLNTTASDQRFKITVQSGAANPIIIQP